MFNILRRLFSQKNALVCGGEGCASVIDKVGREVGRLHYRRPTSDEVLDYVYAEQSALGSEAQLKEIVGTDAKEQARKIHQILVRDLWLPRAEKIFLRCELYLDEHKKQLSVKTPQEQFDHLRTYFAHHLVDMCAHAFNREGVVKKKF